MLHLKAAARKSAAMGRPTKTMLMIRLTVCTMLSGTGTN